VKEQRDSNGALSGYRVLDLTDEKGLFCARLLADMGAQVIRVTKPGVVVTPSANNAGKLDITLNVETQAGQKLFRRLVKTADVVVESYPPGYLESLGLGYARLSELNPRLVMAAITGFGQIGPYKDYKSGDIVASALGGQMYVCGEAQRPPLKPFGNQTYNTAAIFAAIGILLALWRRHDTGKGQHVDISLQDCAAATLDHVLVRYFYEGVVSRRQGSLAWNSAFRIFPCRDGYILLSLFQHWETLVEWLDAEGMAGDLTHVRWRSRDERLKNIDHIIEVLERWTKTHTVSELVAKGQLMRFPWAEVASIADLINSPQLIERGFFTELELPDSHKRYMLPGVLCRLSQSPMRAGNRLPGAGEHNEAILKELGLSEADIVALIRDGVVGD